MLAVRVHDYHRRPDVEEVAEPRITAALDVLVEVGGAGLCRTDLHIVEGQWAAKSNVELPYVIGHENAGWVRDVGAGVTNVAPGDAVICHPLVTCGLCRPCRAGDDMHCTSSRFPGIDCDGGMAQYLLTNARATVRLGEGLHPADVAALADAGLTAYHAVRKALPLLGPCSQVVCIGAGGLGHIGLQCLVAMTAAEVTVLDRSEAALALATELGAHRVVASGPSQVAEVREATHGGADVVMDFVGEQGTEAQGPAMLRRAGSYFVVGYGGHVDIPTIDIIASEINVIGNLVGTYNDLDDLMTLAGRGIVKLATKRYPLAEVNRAMDDLEAGRLVGRGILVP